MKLIFKSKGIELWDDFEADVQDKLDKLEAMLPAKGFEGEVMVRKLHHSNKEESFVVQLTLTGGTIFLRAEEQAVSPDASLDLAYEKLTRQVRRFKDKMKDKTGIVGVKDLSVFGEERSLRKSKRVRVKPMYLSDAIEQMELLDHDFYMFLNQATQRVNVVYRRADGEYGLLEPDEV
ncbi:MAG TPA: HPF/RaiA family ribosome-associated protein [bacterium]|nr:HPF/RaiA family ribosome-associated protein [bacterium]